MKVLGALFGLVLAVVEAESIARGADNKPAESQVSDWVGQWELAETINYTTCDDVSVGDVRVTQLSVSTLKGRLVGSETFGPATRLYGGRIEGLKLMLQSPLRQEDHAGIEIGLDGSGRRVFSRYFVAHGPGLLGTIGNASCAVIYDVKAKRK